MTKEFNSRTAGFSVQQWATIAQGQLTGQLIPPTPGTDSLEKIQIRIFSINDATVRTTESNAAGEFFVSQLNGGPHVLTAVGGGYYASYVLHLLEADTRKADETESDNDTLPIGAVAPRSIDVPLAINSAELMRDVARRYSSITAIGAPKPSPLYTQSLVPENASEAGRPVIQISADGTLKGILLVPPAGDSTQRPAAQMNVLVVSGARTVNRAITDVEGQFSMSEMLPGSYTLVAAGEAGFVAFGFELVGQTSSKPAEQDIKRLVALTGKKATRCLRREARPQICCEVIPVCEVICVTEIVCPNPAPNCCDSAIMEEVIIEEVVGEPLGLAMDMGPGLGFGGGYGGGFGPGGGGFGGGGGGGLGGGGLGLLGLGGALAAAALAGDGGDNNFVPPAASPK